MRRLSQIRGGLPSGALAVSLVLFVAACSPATAATILPASNERAGDSSAGSSAPSGSAASNLGASASVESGSIAPGSTASGSASAGSAAPAISTQLQPGSVDRASIDVRATFRVALSLDFGTRAVGVDSTATIVNTSGGPIDRVELNTVAARLGGGIRLLTVTVDGQPRTPTVEDQTIVVPLGGILQDGDGTTVRVVYRAILRADVSGSDWLFTRADGIAELYRWIPWPSKRIAFDRPNTGDPFMTPVSPEVRLELTSDRPLVVAVNGRRTFTSADRRVQEFVATQVRDMVLAAAPDFQVRRQRVGSTEVRVYARPGARASQMLSAAARAIARMSTLLAPYPYSTYVVAESAGGLGMEGPGIVWIPDKALNLTYDVTHETGHQWFYGLVGNDQSQQPFADEAATDFVARYVLSMRRASRCPAARLDLSIYHYSRACYYEIVYIQGGNLLESLRTAMGSSAFWAGLRGYVGAHRFGFGSTHDLLDALDARTPLNLAARLRTRFPSIY